MTSYSPHDEDPPEPPVSADAITPRGGFMARPGLKVPPRHAVVVRGGEAPESEHIPLLRSSAPPPPPTSEPPPPSASEKITLRAIPTPPSPKVSVAYESVASGVAESLPPPSAEPSSRAPLSDAPFVTSSLDTPSSPAQSQRSAGSRWAIIAAAAAGLILGLASVAAKVAVPSAASQPPQGATYTASSAAPVPAAASTAPAASAAPLGNTSTAPAPSSERVEPKPRTAPPSVKRTIF